MDENKENCESMFHSVKKMHKNYDFRQRSQVILGHSMYNN